MEVWESISKPSNDQHDSTCPFCAGGEPELRGLTTCKGSENSSSTLEGNLGNKPDYILERDIVEEVPVNVVPAAHHLIPGNQAMDGHDIEKYTTTKKNGNLLEDIGYDINGKKNGVWLPTYPEIYKSKKVEVKGKRFDGWDISKYMWGYDNKPVKSGIAQQLPPEEKIRIINIIQSKWGQAHIGDHKGTDYDKACRERLTLLHSLMKTFWEPKCEKSTKTNRKLMPPYGLVERINLQSEYMLESIMPRKWPRNWTEYVSNYALDYAEQYKNTHIGI